MSNLDTESKFRFWDRYAKTYLDEPQTKASSATFVTFVVLVILYFFGINPIWNSINEKKQNIKTKQVVFSQTEKRLKYLDSIEPLYEKNKYQFEKLGKLLPKDANIPDFLQYLSVTSATHGFQISYLSPSINSIDAVSGEGVTATSLIVNLDGRLENVLPLIRALENSERLISIKYVSIGNIDGGIGRVRMEILIYSFI